MGGRRRIGEGDRLGQVIGLAFGLITWLKLLPRTDFTISVLTGVFVYLVAYLAISKSVLALRALRLTSTRAPSRRAGVRRESRQAIDGPLLAKIMELDDEEFEWFVRDIFKASGYKNVKRVGGTGDHGVDVTMEDTQGRRGVIQCKRWLGTIPEKEIRDFAGAIGHFNARDGFFVTTGTFTRNAVNFAKENHIEVIDGTRLVSIVKKSGITIPDHEPKASDSVRKARKK